MKFDFDKIVDRKDTYSIKYDHAARGMPDDTLPMWVADMDIQAPPCVTEALQRHVEHGIFGYSEPDKNYFDAVHSWYMRRFGWNVERSWLAMTPGVVTAVHIAILALTSPGDGIVIQEPVYHPFAMAIDRTRRKLLVNELVYGDGKYSIDFDDFEAKIKQSKLFVLCSPHNPGGRVWELDELTKMGEICLRNGVLVISDEIHQDFVFPGRRHTVFADIAPEFADIAVTCTSPSKTFNLAGLPLSNIFISNKKLLEKFAHECAVCGLGHPGVMSLVACKAAYESGEEWLEELLVYLKGNMARIDEFLRGCLPKVKLVQPEGTYLAWLDCKELGLGAHELDEMVVHEAKLWLDKGTKFGASGAGFQRMNAACPRSTVSDALSRLESVFRKI
ncbi:MAG: pyridoxal phosphate-dependent aminotransferase [Oscillospiraceae bacterium]|nr:pyridoxal phosphate-dependent aminotransferase [Oscillospiraceae bacterium]